MFCVITYILPSKGGHVLPFLAAFSIVRNLLYLIVEQAAELITFEKMMNDNDSDDDFSDELSDEDDF